MSKFAITNRSNDCAVCGDISGKCRTKNDGGQEFVLCMTNGDAKLFDLIDGYKCIKPGSKGWATFTLDTAQPQASYEERQQRRAQREAEEKAIYQAGLGLDKRHAAYSAVLAQLPLHNADRADLERRGLSATTIATFVSIEPWQRLSEPVDTLTPGSNGYKLLTRHSGYLVPARNIEGQITGFQIRNRNGGDGPKYPWLSTQSRPANLQNGELPITYAPGDGGVVNLTEGLLKPVVAAEVHGAKFIGAAGGNFASSPQQLESFLRVLNPEAVVLCPDGGAVVNRQVMHQYRLLAELVKSLGYDFSVRWWGQVDKASGDVDEISREQFEAAQLISWTAFAAKASTAKKPSAKAKPNSAIAKVRALDGRSAASVSPHKTKADLRVSKLRAAKSRLVSALSSQLKSTRNSEVAEIRLLYGTAVSAEDRESAKAIKKTLIQAARVRFSEALSIGKAQLKARCDEAITKARAIRDTKLIADKPPKVKRQTKADWLDQQRRERDSRAYAKIAAMLGIEASIDTESDDYKNAARELFYQPLKQQLKYETHGELSSGFADEMMPTDGRFFSKDAKRSLIAYDCSQGTGKSNNALIPPALRTASGDGRVLIIVPTRGLAREFKGRINERAGEDIAATHLDPKYYSAAVVVTCPESAYKFKGQKFDLLQIDEANEVLHRIESGELGNAGPQSLAAFRRLLATTKTVAIATAAMSGRTLAAVQTIGGFTPDETQLQRRVRPKTPMKVVEYSNFYQWLRRIIKALRSGQRVSIPTGSQGKGRAVDRILRATFPGKSGLVIDGAATLQNQRSRFLSNPDAFLENERPDWFIYTPVINSGVSIEGQHFDIQFEYSTPHEGAQSISQRGERIRSAIGRDHAITERHIYFSEQGAPTLEAYPDALSWQYWVDELADETNAPMGAAAALAKALGAQKALKPMQQDTDKFAAMRPNLPHFLALKAFEIIYKRELLHEDWRRFGWEVSRALKPGKLEIEELKDLQAFCERVRIGLIEQQGRTLKKAQTRESEGDIEEINNPFQAARIAKLQIEKLLGKDYLSQQSKEFFTAWAADKSASNPGVRSVVRSQLLHIAASDPECWLQIERMKALKFLAGKPAADGEQFWHLPELPATARDIELVSIISRCPGVADVIGGKTEQWTNRDPQIIAAGLYLIAHAKQIAANTKRSGLVRGAKFSEQMAPAALFNKALELMGYAPKKDKRQGSGARLNVYRLAIEADAVAAFEAVEEDGEQGLKLFRAELKVIRAQSRRSIEAAAKHQIISRALVWVSEKMGNEVGKAISAIKRRHSDLIESGLSKLGDVTKVGANELPDEISQMALMRAVSTASPSPPPDS